MRHFTLLFSIGAVLSVAATGASSQVPGRPRVAPSSVLPSQPIDLPGKTSADGRPLLSLERVLASESLRTAVRLHDYAKAYQILATLGPIEGTGGPLNQVACPPPNVIQGGHCTLPFALAVDPVANQK